MSLNILSRDVSQPFCDYLRFTVPESDLSSATASLKPYLDSIGCYDDYSYLRSPSGGTYTAKKHYGVASHSFTGKLLADLRDHGIYDDFIAAISLLPAYRLTRADITVDVQVDGADYIPWFFQKCQDGLMDLTKRQAKTKELTQFLGLSFRDKSRITGTVYKGSPKAEIRLVAYDKSQEIFDRIGIETPPLTRIELKLTDKTLVTLRDLVAPSSIFYHFLPSIALPKPENLPTWLPYPPIGSFSVSRAERSTPYARAGSILDNLSSSLKTLGRLAMENPERSEAFVDLLMARMRREVLSGAKLSS